MHFLRTSHYSSINEYAGLVLLLVALSLINIGYCYCYQTGYDGILNNEVELSATVEYDPDVDLTTPELVRRHGYPAESHVALTSDGYLLTLHRIPRGRGHSSNLSRPVVFLQHGLLSSSADWVLMGPSHSLGFILADAGYDVWMGNARGNIYSRSHVTLSPSQSKFWKFSWDEMGLYDLPAALELSLEVTGQKQLYYIGHSMGTTMFFVLASSRPEYTASKVRAMFALAPVAFLEHVKSPIRILAPFSHDIEFLAHFLGADEFLPRNTFLKFLSKFGCELTTTERKICENFIFLLCGFDAAQFNISMLPVILGHTPAGTSTRTLVHYAQIIRSGRFEPYDFGPRMNMKCYNQSTPPEYDLTNIAVPIALHYSDNDWLADHLDVKNLSVRLQQKIGMFRVSLPSFNHVDFMWAKDAPKLVYSKILKALKQYVNK